MKKHLLPGYARNLFLKSSILLLLVISLFLAGNTQAQTSSSLNFDGTDDYAVVGGGNVITTGSYTKEAWIRLNDVSKYDAMNLITEPVNPFYVYYFGRLAAGSRTGGVPAVFDNTPMLADVWYHVAVTYNADNDSMILYKNGVSVARGLADPNDESGPTAIGAILSYGNYGYFFNGDMTEIRIWNYQRSDAEIALTENCRLPDDTPGLVALFNAKDGDPNGDNTTVTSMQDITGNNHNATLFNFTKTGTTSNFTDASPSFTGTCTVLPVTFSHFTAKAEKQSILLTWQTSSEINNAGFALERSGNGNTKWEKIAFVQGSGNSASVKNYQFRDASPLTGANFYRLKQQDMDGHFKVSNVVSASMLEAGRISLYPTVASSVINLSISDQALLQTPFVIFDNSGKTVQKGMIKALRQSINVSTLNKGVYFLKIQDAEAIQFIKQ